MKKKVCIITLGCKVNQYESDSLARMLEENNYETADTLCFADFYVINTCAVTNEAEKKSRQYISKINKVNECAKIIICGCGAEKHKEEYLTKKNVVLVVNNQRKDLIPLFLKNQEIKDEELKIFNSNLVNPKRTKSRAFIKIQDGCNRFCSYCIIPYVKGRSVSRDIESIVKEAEELSQYHKEIVLVGIDMSDYKINGELALPVLMQRMSNINARIRLGSLEVSVITEGFLQVLKNMKNFAPQFHLSLQSGDDFVLKKMNRKYTTQEYFNAVSMIYKYFPNANVTTDVIVGFPFETKELFLNTIEFVKKVGFGKIHYFPFSAKKGTIAYAYPKVSDNDKKERLEIMEKTANVLQEEYNKKFIGKKMEVLIEELEGEYFVGYSENYIKCYIKKSKNVVVGDIQKMIGLKLYKEGLEVE